MKHIQWFPGHMTKAMRMMQEEIDLCDAVIVVLDARCPAASFNPKLKSVFGERPILYVLNKADLADCNKTDAFVKLIESKGALAVKLTATSSSAKRALTAKIERLTAERRKQNAEKNNLRPVRLMVSGVPNTGKSTIINLLHGEKKAITGDKAGVTRGKQWIKCEGFDLMDTPGTMPPAFENQVLARHLAYIGSINDDILEMDEIALSLLSELRAMYPAVVKEKFNTEEEEPLELLNAVCRRRGFLQRGGDYDYERGEKAVVDDFRKGKLGALSLERAEDYTEVEF
ncbi:MAG: ribosome biogenesis GTPase YlqF [Clostridia bacterium]|nr:ribosome biogenesis GTPase YlqF [Clostridia bacterium]